MPRQKKERYCALELKETTFKPRGIEMNELENIHLELDELEAIYLCDYLNHDQSKTAELMSVSRGTVQRLLYSGRSKLVDFIINCKAISITSGDHIVSPECILEGAEQKCQGGLQDCPAMHLDCPRRRRNRNRGGRSGQNK